MLSANAPDRLVKVNNLRSHQFKFSDRIRSCEDVLFLEEHGLAVIACDPGRERWNTVLVSPPSFAHEPVSISGLSPSCARVSFTQVP